MQALLWRYLYWQSSNLLAPSHLSLSFSWNLIGKSDSWDFVSFLERDSFSKSSCSQCLVFPSHRTCHIPYLTTWDITIPDGSRSLKPMFLLSLGKWSFFYLDRKTCWDWSKGHIGEEDKEKNCRKRIFPNINHVLSKIQEAAFFFFPFSRGEYPHLSFIVLWSQVWSF